ncbi:MAG: protease complex subunit PrcB family protein [Phycisphaerales bacterium JB063]
MAIAFEWKKMMWAVALTPAVVLVGCKSDGDSASSGHFHLAEPVELLDGVAGSSAALPNAGTYLITNQGQWERGGFAEACPAPMDFDAHDVVVVALGEKPSAGYWVHIDAIQQVGSELAVQFTANTPADDEVVATVVTYPYYAVAVPKTGASLAVADPSHVTGQAQPE